MVFGGIPAKGVLPVTSGPFKEGESVVLPDRFREEYHHLVGSKDDSLALVQYDMKEMGSALTVLPQVAELVAGEKINLSDTVGELLGKEGADASLTVGNLLSGYKESNKAGLLNELLCKYRRHTSVEEVARAMFAELGMRSTSVSGGVVTTAGYDFDKFMFTIKNGGKYAGKQVLSPKAAQLVLEYF
jgi:hypothetical protein